PSLFSTAPAPTDTYTLSLHDALPISKARIIPPRHVQEAAADHGPRRVIFHRQALKPRGRLQPAVDERLHRPPPRVGVAAVRQHPDRKSTRLNSSHVKISYAVFCLKKK